MTQKTAHTPGPWTEHAGHIGANNLAIADINETTRRSNEEHAANARLIAAAPDLLAVLKEALQDLEHFKEADDCTETHPLVLAARAAIAKAEAK